MAFLYTCLSYLVKRCRQKPRMRKLIGRTDASATAVSRKAPPGSHESFSR